MLTSPALTSVDLRGAYTGAATHDEILKGVKWLAEKLGEDKAAVGLLTYSGHGDQTPKRCSIMLPIARQALALMAAMNSA